MGKFDSRIAERAYSVANSGFADEECGSVDDIGWYAILHFRRASVIIREDSQGFVYSMLGTRAEMESVWADVEAEYTALGDEGEPTSNWPDED